VRLCCFENNVSHSQSSKESRSKYNEERIATVQRAIPRSRKSDSDLMGSAK
ncbi:hypothetical protein Pmar_PMAR001411, partial [Perkinsus marinus ATCC 50983]